MFLLALAFFGFQGNCLNTSPLSKHLQTASKYPAKVYALNLNICDCYSCILPNSNQNLTENAGEISKYSTFHTLDKTVLAVCVISVLNIYVNTSISVVTAHSALFK